MRALPDLHEQVVDVDAEGEVGVYERQHGRRRHDDRCPPGQHVRVVGECRRHGAHTERQETLDDKSVAFVDGDVMLNLGARYIYFGKTEVKCTITNAEV